MTIASELQALATDVQNARTAITAKGGTVTPSGGTSQLATDIATIPTGGGGELLDISPVTSNGTYDAGTDLTPLDGLTFTGNAHVSTDIAIPNACNWDFEAKFKVTQAMSGTSKSALFGTLGSSYQVLLNQTSNAFYIYMHGEYSSGSVTPAVNTEYTVIKSGASVTMNGTALTKNNDNSVSGAQTLDLFAYNEGDGTHSRKFIGVFNYLKFIENGTIAHWFIPVRDENNVPKIYDKTTAKIYSITGAGITLGNDTSESFYDGFASPLTVNVPGGSAKKWGVSVDNFFRNSAKATPDLEDLVIPSGEMPRILGYAFRYAGLKSIDIDDSNGTNVGAYSYCNYYLFADNRNLESVLIDCGDRTSSLGGTSLGYAFLIQALSNPPANPTATFEFRTKRLNGNSCMTYMCQNNVFFKYFSFPNVEGIGTQSYNTMTYCFYNTNQCYKQGQASINQFRFPVLNTIGANSSSYYGSFKSAFSSSQMQTYHYGELLFPEVTTIHCKSASSTYGHFYGCNALNKVYLPKLTNVGTGTTYDTVLFGSCPNITEMHFGIENEATVTAFRGYASKFGASNSTIYFDLVNHITVGGVVYDRSGAEYDFDNSYYSWKNGTAVIYTTDALTPAVGDAVYTKSGTTYTQSGMITAIA